ncbi:MAG TPA: hypothetical protein VF160_17390 [Candidatus Dormibacteraeota bacterium]
MSRTAAAAAALRRVPIGRYALLLVVISSAAAAAEVKFGGLFREAGYFVPAACVAAFLALVEAWDLAVGLLAWRDAPYLVLPEQLQLPGWLAPAGEWLAPAMLLVGIVLAHFFWL